MKMKQHVVKLVSGICVNYKQKSRGIEIQNSLSVTKGTFETMQIEISDSFSEIYKQTIKSEIQATAQI